MSFNDDAKNIIDNISLILANEFDDDGKILAIAALDIDDYNDFGYTVLMYAINSENAATIVPWMLKALQVRSVPAHIPNPVNATNKDGVTALKYAIANASFEVISAVIHYPGIELNKTKYFENPPLFDAIQKEQLNTVQLLLDKGASITLTDRSNTPFTVAAKTGNQAMLELLLRNWKSAESVVPYLEGALREVSVVGPVSMINFLLQQPGINPNAADKYGHTALTAAARNGQSEHVTCLLPHASKENINKAFVAAAGYAMGQIQNPNRKIDVATYKEVWKSFTLLRKAGADINSVDHLGERVMFVLAADLDMLRLTLKTFQDKVEVNTENKEGLTLLIKAVREGNLDKVTAILDAGARPEIFTKTGENAIHAACNVDPKILAALLDKLKEPFTDPAVFANYASRGQEAHLRLLFTHPKVKYTEKDYADAFIAFACGGKSNHIRLLLADDRAKFKAQQYKDVLITLMEYPAHEAVSLEVLAHAQKNNINFDEQLFILLSLAVGYKRQQLLVELLKLAKPNSLGFENFSLLIESAIRNDDKVTLTHLLNHIAGEDKATELLDFVGIAIKNNSEVVLNILINYLERNGVRIEVAPLLVKAAESGATSEVLNILLGYLVRSGESHELCLAGLRYSDPQSAYSMEVMAKRYLMHLHTLSAKDTSAELLKAAKPYKALIVSYLLASNDLRTLEDSIRGNGTRYTYAHGLSMFLHTPVVSDTWFEKDQSILLIKDKIVALESQQRPEEMNHNAKITTNAPQFVSSPPLYTPSVRANP